MSRFQCLVLSCVPLTLVVGCNEEETDPCAALSCGDHGACDPGSGGCLCDSGYVGAACDDCALDCGSHGSCDLATASCACDEGYTGEVCDVEELDCGDHGDLDPERGSCTCDEGYGGASCDECAEGYLSADGACLAAECLDDDGCDDGDPCNGAERCGEEHLCIAGEPVVCSEHARCVPEDGSCACDEGYDLLEGACLREVLGDLGDLTLEAESFWNGADGAGSFRSGGVTFYNAYDEGWGSWDGFAYSNVTNVTTPGYENQYGVITGGGVGGAPLYAVAYVSGFSVLGPPTLELAEPGPVAGLWVTNTTWAYLSMRDGDAYAKRFGGESGEDPDWFLLTVHGLDGEGEELGTVELYLADFRSDDEAEDYILDEWIWLDLGGLGEVTALQFTLDSSDQGDFGMNTPAYFALDDLMRHGR